MLVLTRLAQERIWIGDNIVITVVETKRGAVRIGIEAPKTVVIEREEVRKERLARPVSAAVPDDDASDLRW